MLRGWSSGGRVVRVRLPHFHATMFHFNIRVIAARSTTTTTTPATRDRDYRTPRRQKMCKRDAIRTYLTLVVVVVVVGGGGVLTGARANITYRAKFVGNTRVAGDGVLVHALSVTHCLALCNKDKNCDAITYNDALNKCRLFRRCAPLQPLHASPSYWFYAKRPPVTSAGYFYEERSDSCLKVTNQTVHYNEAYDACIEERAYLAVLNTSELQTLATRLLHEAGHDEAWINPPFKNYEKFAKNKELTIKKKTPNNEKYKNFVSKDPNECWMLQNNKLTKLSSCHAEKKHSICQLPPY